MILTSLDMINVVYGPPSNYIYGLAGAPYFNLGANNSRDDLTSADVLQILGDRCAQVPSANLYDVHAALSYYYGLSIKILFMCINIYI